MQLAQTSITNCNSEHIDVGHHFLREFVGRKDISVIHVGSTLQHADFFKTPIARDDYEFHRKFAMNLLRLYVVIFGFRVTLLL